MTTENSMSKNYKQVRVVCTYLENGKPVTKTADVSNTDKATVEAEVQYTGKGKLVEAAYYFYLRAGAFSNSPYYEVAMVHVVDEEYSESDDYAKKSYANMIDQYTFVEVDDTVAELPREN